MRNFKAILIDFDAQSTIGTNTYLIELDENYQQTLLALSNYLAWKTRYVSSPNDIVAYQGAVQHALMTPIDFCGRVATCLEDNETVREIIRELVTETITETTGTTTGTGTITIGQSSVLDELWSGCLYVVQWLNRLITDMLQNLDANTDPLKRLAYLIGGMPFVETLPIDEVIGISDLYNEITLSQYLGQYDEALEISMACDLFCLAQDNGNQLTIELMYSYYDSLMSLSNPNNWATLLSSLIIGTWIGPQFVYAYYALAVGAGKFFGLTLGQMVDAKQISKFFELGKKNPSDAWQILCDECSNLWEHTFDFTLSRGAWLEVRGTQGVNLASYVAGVGFVAVQDPTNNRRSAIFLDFASADIVDVQLNFDTTRNPSLSFVGYGFASVSPPSRGNVANFISIIPAYPSPLSLEIDATTTRVRCDIYATGTTALGAITAITIRGTGFNPFA